MPPLSQAEFAELHRRVARPLWAYVYHATNNAADADDIVQETFLRMLREELPKLAGDDARRYAFRIASNLMSDRWRASGRERTEADDPALEGVAAVEASDGADVRRIFGQLRRRDRTLLWLAYVEGHSHEEIGTALALARGSVKVMLSRARVRLRDLLRANGLIEDER